ncbi:helix-turn-helix transcriptional regulator [Natronomonas marina]|jgi:uncharacterized membrane protein|uniref:helix-turn-helix transcriptional regulator n=1 Tax=Natronomonas marina TaxID=2961939 RepID=UPI0020C9AD73|nr:MarR family transcriptional regulator [Natronomonas marina]
MVLRALHSKSLLAAAVFVAATLVLAVQLITPTPVVVSVGENGTEVAEIGGYFQYSDVAVIVVAAVLLGASGTYLTTTDWGDADTESPPTDRLSSDGYGAPGRADGTDGSTPSDELLEARRQEWEETAQRLANNEREVYEIILDADGVIAQSDIVDATDSSKATVSRTLDSLETKELVERKRRGMGNIVMLL